MAVGCGRSLRCSVSAVCFEKGAGRGNVGSAAAAEAGGGGARVSPCSLSQEWNSSTETCVRLVKLRDLDTCA